MKNKGVTNQLGFFLDMLLCVHYFVEKYIALKIEYLTDVLFMSPGFKKQKSDSFYFKYIIESPPMWSQEKIL